MATISKKMRSGALNRQIPLHLMLVPAIIIVVIYCYGPLFGVLMAFQKYVPAKGIFGSEWVGFDNFVRMFTMRDSVQIIWNTFYISLLKVLANLVFPIVLALLLNEIPVPFFKRTVQTVLYAPYFLSWVILGGVLKNFLAPDGFVNSYLLSSLGIEPVMFLGDKNIFVYTLVATDLWQNAGFNTIVFLAVITSISPELYEAATVDGANRLKLIRHITLPGMLPIIVLVATLALGNIMNAGFDQVFMLYSPPVYETGDIIDTFVYRMGLLNQQYSLGTAVGLFKSTVSLVLISTSYYCAWKFTDYRIF